LFLYKAGNVFDNIFRAGGMQSAVTPYNKVKNFVLVKQLNNLFAYAELAVFKASI